MTLRGGAYGVPLVFVKSSDPPVCDLVVGEMLLSDFRFGATAKR